MVNGKRVKTVDIHAHTIVPEAAAVINHPLEAPGLLWSNVSDRIAEMDAEGIDVEALSINPFWYRAERDAAAELIRIQNEKLAEFCAATPDRFVAFATVALQHPQLAVEQLEHAIKRLGLRGLSVGGSVAGQELADPKFHPVWAKAEELGILIFMHPLGTRELEPSGRLAGSGLLTNTIGNPLETTIALSHLIFEGTLDRFPGLKICAAHGGGFLPSYANRSDAVITTFPNRVGPLPKKKPTQYLKDGQLYFDSIMFTGEAMRHLIAEAGIGQIMIGTDYPFPWNKVPGGSRHVHPGPQRRRPHRHPRRHRGKAARHRGLSRTNAPHPVLNPSRPTRGLQRTTESEQTTRLDRAADMLEHGTRLALRVQCLAAPAGEIQRPEERVDQLALVVLGDCREPHDLPLLLRQHVAGEIVFVQPVHDEHDGARQLVVQPAVEGMVVPLVRHLALGLRQRLLGLQRIVDDDDVGAAPGQDAADRGGEPAALGRRVEFGHCGALRREAGRENPPIPVAGEDLPAIARQFVGEVLRVADAEDLRRGIMPETPGREGDRGQQVIGRSASGSLEGSHTPRI